MVPTRRTESRLRRHVGAEEPLLALEFGVVIANVVVRLIDLRLHVPVIRLERIQGVTDDANLCVGSRDRQPKWKIIEAAQDLTGLDMLIFRHVHLSYNA